MDGAVLIVDIEPFYEQIGDLLDSVVEVPASTPDDSHIRDTVPDGSSFDRAIVLDGAILGLAAIAEYEYLDQHYPGHDVRKQSIQRYAGKSFDVLKIVTVDGQNKTLYFALSE